MPDNADTIRNRISQETAAAVEAKIAAWFGPDSEYAGYDEAAVLEMRRKVI